jgi:heme-degrading monooxygenase HmoA
MFLFYSVHYPQPGKEALGAEKMRQFDELMKKQPGIIFVSDIFKDPQRGALMGITIWESQEAFEASWPALVKEAPSGDWEVKPPEVYRLNSAS